MATFTVTVTIQGRSIRVDRPRVEMRGLDDVQWRGNEPFSIRFDDPTAFGARLEHARAQTPNRPREGYKKDTEYKYSIIADRDETIELDPVVIVDPGPSGNH